MLENPVAMGELRSKKKPKNVDMQQKPLSKHKSARKTFFTPQKSVKRRK